MKKENIVTIVELYDDDYRIDNPELLRNEKSLILLKAYSRDTQSEHRLKLENMVRTDIGKLGLDLYNPETRSSYVIRNKNIIDNYVNFYRTAIDESSLKNIFKFKKSETMVGGMSKFCTYSVPLLYGLGVIAHNVDIGDESLSFALGWGMKTSAIILGLMDLTVINARNFLKRKLEEVNDLNDTYNISVNAIKSKNLQIEYVSENIELMDYYSTLESDGIINFDVDLLNENLYNNAIK